MSSTGVHFLHIAPSWDNFQPCGNKNHNIFALLVLLAWTLLTKQWILITVMQKKGQGDGDSLSFLWTEHLQGKANKTHPDALRYSWQQGVRKTTKTSIMHPSCSCLCVSFWLRGLSFSRSVVDSHSGPGPAHYTALLTPTYGPADPPPTFSDSCMCYMWLEWMSDDSFTEQAQIFLRKQQQTKQKQS